jgi:hypothetical protein
MVPFHELAVHAWWATPAPLTVIRNLSLSWTLYLGWRHSSRLSVLVVPVYTAPARPSDRHAAQRGAH